MFLRIITLILFLLIIKPTFAGDIKLDADKQVEYHQKEQKLVAKGNAVATKDNLTIKASTLIGYYNPKTKNKISRVDAISNVIMISPEASAWGDKMVYDVKLDTATLTGNPAKIKTNDATITSKGPITYYQSKQKAIAKENVTATDSKGNKVYADLMTAWFTKDSDNKLVLDKIDIEKNVKIISSDTTITALRGTYYAKSNTVKLFDNVVINQNDNILKGAQAETNLNTGISKILSSGSKSRVSGVFKEKKKKE